MLYVITRAPSFLDHGDAAQLDPTFPVMKTQQVVQEGVSSSIAVTSGIP